MNERLKKLAEQAGLDPCVFYDNLLRISDFAELVRADEREACAVLVENFEPLAFYFGQQLKNAATVIRARGNHEQD
tara:strand:- start:1156 stop:1383 length:228 start_codon:yes stop_codon:yes gene_type:complete